NPDLFGKQFLGKYLVITTSGTTGAHGIFLTDKRTLSVVGPLFLRMLGVWLGLRDLIRIIGGGGRIASQCRRSYLAPHSIKSQAASSSRLCRPPRQTCACAYAWRLAPTRRVCGRRCIPGSRACSRSTNSAMSPWNAPRNYRSSPPAANTAK